MLIRLALFVLSLLFTTAFAAAQEPPTIRDVLEADSRSEEVLSQVNEDSSTLQPGETPLSTVLAIRAAVTEKDWATAARYLDTRYLPEDMQERNPEILMRQLSIVWNQQRIVDFSAVSNNPEGHLDDGLPSYRDALGKLSLTRDEEIPIYLQRVPAENGGRIWKVSNATARHIPDLWKVYGYNPRIAQLEDYLPNFNFLYLQNWQVVGLLLIVVGAGLIAFSLRWLLLKLIAISERYRDSMHQLVAVPMPWFVFFKLVQMGVAELGLSIKARIVLNESALGYIATTFLVLASIELVTALFLSRASNVQYWSGIIRPVRTILKILSIIVVFLLWLSEAGYDINTVLAGLGIGSLALALAAQKTLENMIGAITLYIAQPIRPGDFCKVGDIIGIVEEIGLRSTRIRRLDRTVVHVPNASLVSVSLENISENDRRRYSRQLRLALDATPDQLRLTLQKLRELLHSHPNLLDIAVRARFESIERDAYLINLNAYVNSAEYDIYMAVSEDLNLRILSILQECGVQLAVPQQRVLIKRDTTDNSAASIQASSTIDTLEQEQRLAFPDFTAEEKAALRGQIRYPERGHSET